MAKKRKRQYTDEEKDRLDRLLASAASNPELDRILHQLSPSTCSADADSNEHTFGYHTKRARLGVWCCHRNDSNLYERLKNWKAYIADQETFTNQAAGELVSLIRTWQPVLPRDWLVTVPPAGASIPGPYPAGFLGRKVAELLDLDFVTMIERTDAKRYHGRHYTLSQKPFTLLTIPTTPVLVVDDISNTGKTMQLSLEAINGAGAPAFGFAFYLNA